MVIVSQQIKPALKEWAIAVEALSRGKTIMLLRKGGIRERNFRVQHKQMWLYPTYEHQKPHLLKPEYADQVTAVVSGWHPPTVIIHSCAEITEVISLSSQAQLEGLQPYHIWNKQMISDRFQWQPQRQLLVLLLRVYRLDTPQRISTHPSYRGCQSWINLIEPITGDKLIPVMSDAEYAAQVNKIKALL